MRCRKCGSEKMGVMPNKKNPAATDLYCLECGAWQKFATRDEIRLYQTRKFVITNADRIRAMSDEELATFISEIADECERNTECNQHCYGCDIEYCVRESCLKWLHHPAEEDDHE